MAELHIRIHYREAAAAATAIEITDDIFFTTHGSVLEYFILHNISLKTSTPCLPPLILIRNFLFAVHVTWLH